MPALIATPQDTDLFRLPPAHSEAEQALLGAILVDNRAYHKVSEFLRAEHFAQPVHGRIFAAIQTLIERQQLANPITLQHYFASDASLAPVGGVAYLIELAKNAVSIINVQDFGKAIYDCHLRRELIDVGTTIVNDAYSFDLQKDAHAQIEVAEQRLFDLADSGEVQGGFQPLAEAVKKAVLIADAAYKRDGKTAGVSTGFIDLDKMMGGLHPSDLLILAGRPSMGKTALATNIAFHAARNFRAGLDALGKPIAEDGAVVGFFSLEMSGEQLATRILAEVSGVSGDRIRRGDVDKESLWKFIDASNEVTAVPLHIDDTPALTISALRTRARRLKSKRGLGLLVVDYLQLLQGSESGRASDSRVQEISEITRGLKAIAKELDIPVLALSQLSRAVEAREDKRPQLADLRESGSIEQDADVVLFVFREEYYLSRQEPARRADESDEKFNDRYYRWRENLEKVHAKAEVIVAKQRHGPIGKVTLHFDGSTTKFSNYSGGPDLDAP